MFRRFFKDSAIYALSSVLARGTMVLLVPLFTRLLDADELGRVYLLQSGIALINIVFGLELVQGLAREYADAPDSRSKGRFASSALWVTILLYGCFVVIASPLSARLSVATLGRDDYSGLINATIWAAATSGVFVIVSNQLRWGLKPAHSGVVSLIFTFTNVAAAIVLVKGFGMGAAGVLWGVCTGALVGSLCALVFTWREFCHGLHLAELTGMLKIGIPLLPSSIAGVATLYANQWILNEFADAAAIGRFGVMVRLASMVGFVMIGFSSALMPLIYTHHQDSNTPIVLARIFRYFSMIALMGAGLLSLFSEQIISIFSTKEYLPGALTLSILVPAILIQQAYIFAPGAWIQRKMWIVSLINIVTAAICIGVNYWLIPIYGELGAALATLGCGILCFWASMAVSQRFYHVPHRWSALLIAVGMTALVVVLGRLMPSHSVWSQFWVRLPIAFVLPFCIWGSGLISWREVAALANKLKRAVRA